MGDSSGSLSEQRSTLEQLFSGTLAGGISSPNVKQQAYTGPGGLGNYFTDMFSLPQYQGQLSAGLTPGQVSAQQLSQLGLSLFGGGVAGQPAASTTPGVAGGTPANGVTLMPQAPGPGANGPGTPGYTAAGTGVMGNMQNILNGLTSALSGSQGYLPPEALSLLRNLPGASALTGISQGGGPGSAQLGQIAQNQQFMPGQAQQLVQTLSSPNVLNQIAGGQGPGGQALQQLSQAPTDLTQLQGLLTGGLGQNQGLMQLLQQATGQAGGQQPLSNIASQAPGITQQATAALGNLAQGGGGQNYQQLFQAMQQAAQGGTDRATRDLREQFSFGGNRISSDLANAMGTMQTEQQSNLNSQMLQAAMQAAGSLGSNQLGAAQSLGQLGLGAATGLSQAGLQGQGQNIQAAGTAAGTTGNNQALLAQIAQTMGSLGLQGQSQQAGAAGQLQNAALNAGAQTGTQGLNLASLLTSAFGQNQGQQLTAAQQQQQAALQASGQLGTQSTNLMNTLTSAFGNQQGLNLQALLGAPGALQTTAMLPQQVAAAAMPTQTVGQTTEQDALTKAYEEYQRTQGALFGSVMGYAAGTPVIPSTIPLIGGSK